MSVHICDEIHVFANIAERTGATVDLGGMRREPRVCTTLSDLLRKHRQFGDGHFYLPQGQWPEGSDTFPIDQLKPRARRAATV